MTAPLRLLTAALVFASPLVASAAPGDSDLDRLSETSTYASPETDPLPIGGEDAVGPCGNAPCPPADAPPVPLDGGLSLLAIAGAAYAAKRLRARRA